MLDSPIFKLNKQLYVLFSASLINRLGTFVFPFFSLYLVNEKEVSLVASGTILSLGATGLVVGAMLSGYLVDKVGAKPVLVTALITNIVGYFLLTFSYDHAFFYALPLFIGLVGMSMFGPANNLLIAQLSTHDERSLCYTLNYLCINIGMGLGPLAASMLMTYSFHLLFYVDMGTSLICALILAFYTFVPLSNEAISDNSKNEGSEPDISNPASSLSYWKAVRTQPILALICISNLPLISSLFALEYMVPLLVNNIFMSATLFMGLVYSLNSAIILIGSLPLNRIVSKMKIHQALAISSLLWSSGLFMIYLGFSVNWLLASVVVWTLGEIVISISLPSHISTHSPENSKGKFMGINEMVGSISRVLTPICIGALWHSVGVENALLWVALFPLVTLGIAIWVFVSDRQSDINNASAVS
ncbi:MFS transporter [Vibrio sp. S9_S30]|uniref:MFS transporter n=1 Tax=Vibrio sp. S9_S30 TaxID=2720226 RepID=UPI001680A28C|nr:MFS transporter [Vibrio sp. S9_S30]MBD1557780.1 MFS transporter [Vibrio sp. S9_S30]